MNPSDEQLMTDTCREADSYSMDIIKRRDSDDVGKRMLRSEMPVKSPRRGSRRRSMDVVKEEEHSKG